MSQSRVSTPDVGAPGTRSGWLTAVGRAMVRPRLLTTLAWAAALTAGLDIVVLRAGLSLRMPFGWPERTAKVQAWRENGLDAAVVLVGDSLVGTDVTVSVLEDELHHKACDEQAFNLWGPGSNLLADVGVVDYAFGRGAKPRVVFLGLCKREVALLQDDMDSFARRGAEPAFALWLLRKEPSWLNARVLAVSCLDGPSVLLQWPLTVLPQYEAQLADARLKRGSEWASGSGRGERPSDAWDRKAAPGTPEWQRMVDGLRSDPDAVTLFRPTGTIEAALERATGTCRAHGASPIVANMPLYPERTAIEREYGYDAYVDWLRTSCAELRVTFVDLNVARYLPPEEDFFDTQHMKPDAAERFTRQVTGEIILPALEAQDPRGHAQP